jgi:hypothetical protein
MRKKIIIHGVTGIVILMLFGVFSSWSFAAPVTLRFGHTAGTVLNYTLTMDTPGAQSARNVSMTITQDVKSVDAQEVMEITTSISNATMTVNGVPVPFTPQGEILDSKITRKGEVKENTAKAQYKDIMTQAGFTTFTSVTKEPLRSLGVLEFPDDAKDVGDSWSITKSQDFPNGTSMSVTYTFTLEAFETVLGYNCAKIVIASQPVISYYQDFPNLRAGMYANGTVKVAGVLYFAHAEGKVVKINDTIESNSIGTLINYDGGSTVIPFYQKTVVSLELQ